MVCERRMRHPRSLCRFFGAIAAAAGIATSPAVAAPENPYGGGTRIPQEVERIDRGHHQTRMILRDFARCNIKAHRDAVRKYLLEDVGQKETAKLREKALSFSCLDGEIGPDDLQVRFTGPSLQGSLAEEMLPADGFLSRPLDVAVIAPLHHSSLTAEELKKLDAAGRTESLAQEYVFRFGECVIRADVADSESLLRSEPDSDAENAAFGRLMPAFRSCVEANRTLTADKIEIRGSIAYNYYRLASVSRSPTATTAVEK